MNEEQKQQLAKKLDRIKEAIQLKHDKHGNLDIPHYGAEKLTRIRQLQINLGVELENFNRREADQL